MNMKKITSFFIVLAICLCSSNAYAFDLKTVLKDAASMAGSTDVGSLLGGLISSDNISVADLTGTWSYSKPSVKFKSDNLLKKAGGVAAATAVESKLVPYYNKLGINKMTFTVNADSTFSMKVRGVNFSGVIAQAPANSKANFVLQFKALKTISIGSLDAYVTKSGNTLDLTFDVSKLMTLLKKVGSVTGNSTLNSINKLLEQYDGLCAGFELKK